MIEFEKILSGGDLRSLGKSYVILSRVNNQNDFDELFKCLYHTDRLIVMRAADAIEKLTANNTQYLTKHKKDIFELCQIVKNKELQWHLALLMPRLHLEKKEFGVAWNTLTKWAKDKANSRIVRVNSIQGLFEMMKQQNSLMKDFRLTLQELENENIPSINARIKKFTSLV